MQYASHANNLDIVSETRDITGTTSTSYAIEDITRRVNAGITRAFKIGFEITGDVSLDDDSKSTTPIGYQNLTTGVNAYGVAGFSGTFTNFLKLEALDSAGNPVELGEENLIELNFSELYSTALTGVPSNFVKVGGTYYVRPTPNYTKASGLIGFGNRKPDFFTTTDTTKEPPKWIPEFYLPRYAAQPFLEKNGLKNSQSNFQHILEDEREIKNYFIKISKNTRPRLSAMGQNNK